MYTPSTLRGKKGNKMNKGNVTHLTSAKLTRPSRKQTMKTICYSITPTIWTRDNKPKQWSNSSSVVYYNYVVSAVRTFSSSLTKFADSVFSVVSWISEIVSALTLLVSTTGSPVLLGLTEPALGLPWPETCSSDWLDRFKAWQCGQ